MARQTQWKDLTVGVIASAVVIVGAALILIFGRVGMLHGKKIELFLATDAARGVIRGSEVWLDGQRVGTVKSVEFRPPTIAASERLILALDVLKEAQPHIRHDTRVQIRAGGNLVGDQVVYLSSGTARRPVVSDGDTLRAAAAQTDMEGVTSDMALASREFPAIIANTKLLASQLKSVSGTLGAFGIEKGGPEMQRVRARTDRVLKRLSDPRGTLRLALNERGALRARARRAMAQVDSVRALLASDEHSLGRFRRDSTLVNELQSIRAEFDEIRRLAADPSGTIGRFRADSAITREIHRDLAAFDSLFADIKKRPFRYLVF
jgi:phospholipid/cholesterol/gamma-HCH transport system substrate-binding protein